MPTALPSATPMVRRARAVLFAGAIGATAIGGAAACTKEPQGQPPQIAPQPGPTDPTAIAMDGAPAPPPEVDAGPAAVPPQPAQPPTGPVAMYGAAPPPRKP